MNVNTVFPSKYLKADELEGDVSYTISHVELEELGQGVDKETKPVAYFTETDKGVALNKTNCATIAGLYGPETDDWAGKRITLFAQEVDFQGRQVLAIRVRMRAPAAPSIAKTLTAKSEANAQTGVPPTPSRACWDLYVGMVDQHGASDPGDAYTDEEKKEVFAKILKALFPDKTMKTMTPQDWTSAQESIVEKFAPATRDIIPF